MMWLSLFRAEWKKVAGNRWVTGCMIWIFPLLPILGTIIMLFAMLVSEDVRTGGFRTEPPLWTDLANLPWAIPNNPLGRVLLLGFTAVQFAGEYQWNTWKSVVPRTKRMPIIMVKFITVALFVLFAFMMMSIVLVICGGILTLVAGGDFGPSLNGEVLSTFIEDYLLQMFLAFTSTIIAAGFVTMAAMITKSIIGSAVIGVVIAIGESMLILPLYLLANLFGTNFFMHLYRFTPGYNLYNLFTYLSGEKPEGLNLPFGDHIVDTQVFHEFVLFAWVVGLIALTVYLFKKQDIVN